MALLVPTGLHYVSAMFACFAAGVVAVPAYPPRAVREQFGLTQAAFAAWIGVPLATLRNW